MSQVTNVMISFSSAEHRTKDRYWNGTTGEVDQAVYENVTKINQWLKKQRHQPLAKLDDYAGGEKVFTSELFLGAFNMLNLEAFLSEIRQATWIEPHAVQVFIMRPDDDVFTIYTI